MWEERYKTPDYLFGTEPARFLKTHEALLTAPQTALSVADGEGRNSVFLAQKGLSVTALEYAPSAIAKAKALAAARGVQVAFCEADVLTYPFEETYDMVLGIFIQFLGPEARAVLFERMKAAVKPGGLMLLHGYTPEQIAFQTGGPPQAENMYTEDLLKDAFPDWTLLTCQAYEAEISEGTGHAGRSALIDFIARKPA
ncbi:class I SAM-dependent methyltransferase [uncultured Lentibacter sp.]|uniref:class I SAM-dependent methyltransferase n=1 Tax=uncultured Lentibacter sp. TaxID=1659309 RepID=UPI00261BEFAB|nr:class I SAM-dependent methyltransferase [uncultured Lentibacter sp.]